MTNRLQLDIPDAKQFNPEEQAIPHREDIPEILEFKLDVLMINLFRIKACLDEIKQLLTNILAVLRGILNYLLVALPAIIAALTAILFQLMFANTLLSLILFFLLFIVIRVVVPFLIRQARTP